VALQQFEMVEVSQRGGDGMVEGGEAETTRRRWRGEGWRSEDGEAETSWWRAATHALSCG
jgi:hypothetical protein